MDYALEQLSYYAVYVTASFVYTLVKDKEIMVTAAVAY